MSATEVDPVMAQVTTKYGSQRKDNVEQILCYYLLLRLIRDL